jgi:hypothetical protein
MINTGVEVRLALRGERRERYHHSGGNYDEALGGAEIHAP